MGSTDVIHPSCPYPRSEVLISAQMQLLVFGAEMHCDL